MSVYLYFPSSNTVTATVHDENLHIRTEDGDGILIVEISDRLKDQLRDVVRGWDMDDEAEARGEAAPAGADIFSPDGPNCSCGHLADMHDDDAPHGCHDQVTVAPTGVMGQSSLCSCAAYDAIAVSVAPV